MGIVKFRWTGLFGEAFCCQVFDAVSSLVSKAWFPPLLWLAALSLVSLSESVRGSQRVDVLVRPRVPEYIVGFREKVRFDSEVYSAVLEQEGASRVYVDQALRRPQIYRGFLRQLRQRGMSDFSTTAECVNGVFSSARRMASRG